MAERPAVHHLENPELVGGERQQVQQGCDDYEYDIREIAAVADPFDYRSVSSDRHGLGAEGHCHHQCRGDGKV